MPNAIAVRREVLKTDKYLFRDEFWGNIVNQYRWTVTNTENKISVSGGNVVFAGGLAAPGWADPALVSPRSWPRVAGLTIEWEITPGAANDFKQVGFTGSPLAVDQDTTHAIYPGSGVFLVTYDTNIGTPLAYSAATSYWGRIVCKATGAEYYVSTDGRLTWKLIWSDASVTTTPLYAFIESYNAALTASACRVFRSIPKQPILSDTFTRDDSALTLGSAETGQAWTAVAGTWGVETNKAYSVTSAGNDIATIDPGVTDGIMDCDIVGTYDVAPYSLPDMVFHYNSATETLILELQDGVLTLWKNDAGYTSLATAAQASVSGTTYSVRVITLANAINVYFDGVLKIAYTLAGGDTKFAAYTKFGCRHGGNAGAPATQARWDNLKFQSGLP